MLALLSAWLAMTVGKVQQYLSEPTSTSTHWEKDDHLPAFSVCPSRTVNDTINKILMHGSKKQRANLFGNLTLLEFFWMIGPKTDDILIDVMPTKAPGEFKDIYGIKWKTSVNYLFGGLCATTTLFPEPSKLWSHVILKNRPDFIRKGYVYNLILHGTSEYWGEILPTKQTYAVINSTRLANIIVTTDRETRENLRRAPCEADPDYSQAACEHRCFFDRMNCSFGPSGNSSKRVCMATDYSFYRTYTLAKRMSNAILKNNCSCPNACIHDSYTISTRVGQPFLRNYMELYIQTSGIRKVLHTTVSYTVSDLAADLGGFLGLFLGWSLLTLFELLENGLAWMKNMYKRRSLRPTAVQAIIPINLDIEGGRRYEDGAKIRKLKIVF